ncbi:MAG: hypothetical protein QF855_01005, partial [Candidatus Pacebacteria bacterium]|nr:hypothetical protein [Candidatus Paceibacterota bacterium]
MFKKLIDPILSILEKYSGKLNSWAWTKRWKNRKKGTGYASNGSSSNLEYGVQLKKTSKEWIKG